MSNDELDNIMPRKEETEIESQESEEAAATALTSLGASAPKPDEDDDEDEDEDGKAFSIPQRFTKSGRKRAVPFALKLMKVLSDKNFSHIITWMPTGESFSIVKPKAFVADILPDHFKSAKYSSFTRKLHRWGFMRHYRGDEAGAFYHKDFKKDRMDLVEKMTCHKAEPPKAPAMRKTQQTPSEPAAAPAQSVQRLVPRPAAVQHQQLPVPQPRELVAQLQQHQQQLKVPELSPAEKLNAAIEMEVTRRLKERIQAAAVSRQALALVQQHLNPPSQSRTQWNLAAGSLQAHMLQIQQQQKLQQGYEASCLPSSTGFQRMESGLEDLPRTNIQGAKTA